MFQLQQKVIGIFLEKFDDTGVLPIPDRAYLKI